MKYITEAHFSDMRKGILSKGDVLMVKDGATTGKMGYWDFDYRAAVNEHVFIFRVKDQILSKYLYNVLLSDSFQYELEPYIKGIIGGISLEIKTIRVPLPPLEIQTGDGIGQFLETRFLDSCFSPRDFGDIIGNLLEAEQLGFDQWEQVVNKGLELSYDQVVVALRSIAVNDLDDGKRFNAIRVLQENGEIDEEFKKSIINNEKGTEILEILKN